MVLSIVVFIAVSLLSQTFGTAQQSALFRDRHINFGNFKWDWRKRLSAEKITSFLIEDDELDCPLKCLGEPRCFSFNIAAYPDSKGLHLCEVLAKDKYRAKNMLQTNASFNHCSPWVS